MVPADARQSVTVTFAPTTSGPFSGSFVVQGDDGTGAYTVTFSGTGD
jgi:hypothetical protein